MREFLICEGLEGRQLYESVSSCVVPVQVVAHVEYGGGEMCEDSSKQLLYGGVYVRGVL